MQYVLFTPLRSRLPADVNAMFKAVIKGLDPLVKPLKKLSELRDNEIPILSAVYTEENRAPMAKIVASGRPYVVLDHSWFSELRGKHFRIVADGFQPKRLVTAPADWQRYRSLGLKPVEKWRKQSGKVLFLPHSQRFGEIFKISPDDLKGWIKQDKPSLQWQTEVTTRDRHAAAPWEDPETAILSHRALVGFNTEMLLRALRMGVPAIGHPSASVVHAFNGLTPENLDTPKMTEKSVTERTKLCATLATYYQGSLEELATPGFIESQLANQRNYH